jgi:hypothetical protein
MHSKAVEINCMCMHGCECKRFIESLAVADQKAADGMADVDD